jgi:hypothetical protein
VSILSSITYFNQRERERAMLDSERERERESESEREREMQTCSLKGNAATERRCEALGGLQKDTWSQRPPVRGVMM